MAQALDLAAPTDPAGVAVARLRTALLRRDRWERAGWKRRNYTRAGRR